MTKAKKINRRQFVKDASTAVAGASVIAAGSGASLGLFAKNASAASNLRSEILKIPGVGKGSPTDSDWQKVGAMCLNPTKARVSKGEFDGVELTFMGLNNQNLHNFLFRGFLKPWEKYTGAKIKWIDLAQADYNARLQQSIATQTVDFDILEMGAPFEGDVCGKGLASEMPEWVKEQIEMDDYVDYLKAPVGTWNGKTYRISIDGDCHNFNYRADYFKDAGFAAAWKAEGHKGTWGVPQTWQQVQEVSKFLKGKKDPTFGGDAYGYLDPAKGWGGFGFYFLASRATAYAKHPNDPAWLFDADTMKPRVNNPAWVRAIQDVIDVLPSQPANQLNADPGTTAFQQFLAGTGSMLSWWGDVGSMAKTSDGSVVGDVVGFDILPGSDDVYNSQTGKWDTLPGGPNYAPNMAYIGWGVYVMARPKQVNGTHCPVVQTTPQIWPTLAGEYMSWLVWTVIPKSVRLLGVLLLILAAKTSLSGLLLIRQVSNHIVTVTSTLMNGSMQDMTGNLSLPIWTLSQIPTTILMLQLNLVFLEFSSTTV